MSPKQACVQLKELGFNLSHVGDMGAEQWKLGAQTIFIPCKSQVSESLIRSARRYALNLSIESVPVQRGV